MSAVTGNSRFKFILALACLACALGLTGVVKGDTTAVTPAPSADGLGFAYGAIGFSFTPQTNILVTQVGCLNGGMTQPVLKFWSGTNYVFASYDMPQSTNPADGLIIYTNASLTLFAGQDYTVTVEDGAAPLVPIYGYLNFQVAAELTNYSVKQFYSGAFIDHGPGSYALGPDFTFTNQAVPVVSSPQLTLAQAGATDVVISWPAPSTGFVLQGADSLDTPSWTVLTNVVTVGGTNQVVDTIVNDRFYRLYHP